MSNSLNTCAWSVLGAVLLSSCASTAPADKAQTGSIIGAITGAVIGATVSSKKDRGAGMVLGAALGGATGYLIGQHLDERDRASLQARIDELAKTQQVNKPAIWNSGHSGASAEIVVGQPVAAGEATKRVLTEVDVELPRPVRLTESGTRYASANLNVRSGPGTSYPVKYTLPLGKRIEILGTSENNFHAVSESGVLVGYVSSDHLSKDPIEPKRMATQRRSANQGAHATRSISDTEPVERPRTPTREGDLRISLQCKPVTIRVRTNDGRVSEEKSQTCMRADGTWGS